MISSIEIQDRFIKACESGDIKGVKSFLASGVDVNGQNSHGDTALHFTCKKGHFQIASLLISSGSNIQAKDSHGLTPLHVAAYNGHVHLVKHLLTLGADVTATNSNEWTPLHVSVYKGHADVVKCLLDSGASIYSSSNGWTPLHVAAYEGHPDIASILIEAGSDLRATESKGGTPLHWAAQEGHEDVARVLIKMGAPLSAQNAHGLTPLHVACDWNHLELVRVCVNAGADINAEDAEMWTPLHIACIMGHSNVAQFLIDSGANLSAQDKDGQTPLHVACYRGQKATSLVLLDAGASLRVPDASGDTALHWAASWNHVDLVLALLNHKTTSEYPVFLLDIQDDHGDTPLHCAITKGNEEVEKALVSFIASHSFHKLPNVSNPLEMVNVDGETPLFVACKTGSYFGVSLLVSSPGSDEYFRSPVTGDSCLHAAIRSSNVNVVGMILDIAPKLCSVSNANDESPLDVAVSLHPPSLDICKLCVERGVPIDYASPKGRTVMHRAVEAGEIGIISWLLSLSGNTVVETPDVSGTCPIQLASSPTVTAMLSAYVKERSSSVNEGKEKEKKNTGAALLVSASNAPLPASPLPVRLGTLLPSRSGILISSSSTPIKSSPLSKPQQPAPLPPPSTATSNVDEDMTDIEANWLKNLSSNVANVELTGDDADLPPSALKYTTQAAVVAAATAGAAAGGAVLVQAKKSPNTPPPPPTSPSPSPLDKWLIAHSLPLSIKPTLTQFGIDSPQLLLDTCNEKFVMNNLSPLLPFAYCSALITASWSAKTPSSLPEFFSRLGDPQLVDLFASQGINSLSALQGAISSENDLAMIGIEYPLFRRAIMKAMCELPPPAVTMDSFKSFSSSSSSSSSASLSSDAAQSMSTTNATNSESEKVHGHPPSSYFNFTTPQTKLNAGLALASPIASLLPQLLSSPAHLLSGDRTWSPPAASRALLLPLSNSSSAGVTVPPLGGGSGRMLCNVLNKLSFAQRSNISFTASPTLSPPSMTPQFAAIAQPGGTDPNKQIKQKSSSTDEYRWADCVILGHILMPQQGEQTSRGELVSLMVQFLRLCPWRAQIWGLLVSSSTSTSSSTSASTSSSSSSSGKDWGEILILDRSSRIAPDSGWGGEGEMVTAMRSGKRIWPSSSSSIVRGDAYHMISSMLAGRAESVGFFLPPIPLAPPLRISSPTSKATVTSLSLMSIETGTGKTPPVMTCVCKMEGRNDALVLRVGGDGKGMEKDASIRGLLRPKSIVSSGYLQNQRVNVLQYGEDNAPAQFSWKAAEIIPHHSLNLEITLRFMRYLRENHNSGKKTIEFSPSDVLPTWPTFLPNAQYSHYFQGFPLIDALRDVNAEMVKMHVDGGWTIPCIIPSDIVVASSSSSPTHISFSSYLDCFSGAIRLDRSGSSLVERANDGLLCVREPAFASIASLNEAAYGAFEPAVSTSAHSSGSSDDSHHDSASASANDDRFETRSRDAFESLFNCLLWVLGGGVLPWTEQSVPYSLTCVLALKKECLCTRNGWNSMLINYLGVPPEPALSSNSSDVVNSTQKQGSSSSSMSSTGKEREYAMSALRRELDRLRNHLFANGWESDVFSLFPK